MSDTRAIVVAMHKYTPFGGEFYEPIYDFFIHNLEKYKDEFDRLYIVDSNWGVGNAPEWATVIKVSPHLRYYDAYKEVLPQVKEDSVLFMDNDMVVYRKGMIGDSFAFLEEGINVVSIYDTIGTWKTEKMNGKNKFCPYWFCTRKYLLSRYLDIDWSPDSMPDFETLGKLTKEMIENNLRPYEWPEDKNSIYFDGRQDEKMDLGYYHIRSGSVPAYLLATKKYGDIETYNKYIAEQPKNEYLRQCAWYEHMGGNMREILEDLDMSVTEWELYMNEFKEFHGLK